MSTPLRMTIGKWTVSLDGVTSPLQPPLMPAEFSKYLTPLRLAANGPPSKEYRAAYLTALKKVEEKFLVAFGRCLFRRIFVGQVKKRYQETSAPLALTFEEEASEWTDLRLNDLPWELLHDGTGWVARERGILRLAQVAVPPGSGEAPPGARLRVLVAMASPLLDPHLEPDDPRQPYVINLEREAMPFRNLDRANFPANFTLCLHATRQDLSQELCAGYHVFHFLGHGNLGILALEDRHGLEDVVRTDWLRERVLRTGLGLAVLQSCLTAADAPQVPGVARTLLEAGLPRVLAMQHSITVDGAQAFFARFYAELARSVSLCEALRRARLALADAYDSRQPLSQRKVHPWEWSTPVLWLRDDALESATVWPALAGKGEALVKVEECPAKPPLNPMMQRVEQFVGRRAELVQVAQGIDPQSHGRPRIVLLHGEGGMGKTTIATEAAHRWAHWFEQVVWLSARGKRAPEEVEPHLAAYARESLVSDEGTFLADLAEALELPRGTPLRDILKTLDDGRRRLLVLDNLDPFARSATVLDLLSHLPSNCRALVTSRVKPNLNVVEVPVLALRPRDGEQLVRDYAGFKELDLHAEQMAELLRITGRHALSLRLVVAQVTSGAKTWEHALADLRRAEGPVFDYVFADSLALAKEWTHGAGPRLFRVLAAFAPWAIREYLQATDFWDEASLGQALKALLDLSLVERYPDRRFGLQELALFKSRQMLHEAFLEDREGLLHVVEWAYRQKDWSFVLRLAGNLVEFYSIRSLWPDWDQTHEKALEAARQLGNRQGEGTTLMNLGIVYYLQGRWEEAIAMHEQALSIFRQLGDRQGEAQTLNNLGLVYADQGRWEEAIAMYEQALSIFRQLGDRQGEAQTLGNLGNVYRLQGRWEEAIAMYEQALPIFRQLGDRQGEGTTLTNLGSVYRLQGRWEEAIAMHEQALSIFRQLGNRQGEGTTLANMGILYQKLGQKEKALALWQEALTKLHPSSPEYQTVKQWCEET